MIRDTCMAVNNGFNLPESVLGQTFGLTKSKNTKYWSFKTSSIALQGNPLIHLPLRNQQIVKVETHFVHISMLESHLPKKLSYLP